MQNILLILVLLISGAARSQDTAVVPSYDFFTRYADSVLVNTLEKDDLEWYNSHTTRPQTLNRTFYDSAEDWPLKEWYLGNMYVAQMPAFCDLYQVDLQGDAEKEYVGVISLSDALGGVSFFAVFDNNTGQNRLLGEIPVCSHRKTPKWRFDRLHLGSNRDIIITSDIFQSRVFITEEVRVVRLEADSLSIPFQDTTMFIGGDTPEQRAQIEFVDENNDGESEITVTPIFRPGARPAGPTPSPTTYRWNPDLKRYSPEPQSDVSPMGN